MLTRVAPAASVQPRAAPPRPPPRGGPCTKPNLQYPACNRAFHEASLSTHENVSLALLAPKLGTKRALPVVMMSRCTLVALLTLGTADALGLGGNRRRLLKLGSAAGFLGGGVERLAGRGAAANAATPPVAVGETNSVVRVVGVV